MNTAVEEKSLDTEEYISPSYFDPDVSLIAKTIIIGAGPAGIRFAQEILKKQPLAKITLFGNEPHRPYNRVQLSALLAGEIEYEEIHSRLPEKDQHPGFEYQNCAIESINTLERYVKDKKGEHHPYTNLVIATGARPHTPNIPGYDQQGVYTFRSLKDTEFLFSRITRARHIVVIGGGLLGLEAARALLQRNTHVTLIQQGQRLMNRQLDDKAAELLKQKVEALGINVIVNSGVRKILGDGRVTGVVTRDKQEVPCDTVLVCAGIKPNKEIARDAKIKVGNGIVVDDHLRTSAANVYAIGECSEHRGQTYGLVNPGYEQASICADNIEGGKAKYIGSLAVSRLKVVGESVCSMGEVADIHPRPRLHELTYTNKKKNIYRKLVIHKGKLIGALAYGEWNELQRVQEAYQHRRRILPWQALRFLLTGNPFFSGGGDAVKDWPLTTTICQCNNISHGDLIEAIDNGHTSLADIQQYTGASTVCGSCKPLVEQLIGAPESREKEKAWLPTLLLSSIAVVLALLVSFVPAFSTSDSVQTVSTFESIWTDKLYKQITGFSLLGMSALGLLMSIRKKNAKKKWGDFSYWRLFHITLGALCASTLILHTGFHLGENLNQVLMINFLAILILGALSGAIISLTHTMKAKTAIKLRRFWSWAHILFSWPLPALLAIHIITVYYF